MIVYRCVPSAHVSAYMSQQVCLDKCEWGDGRARACVCAAPASAYPQAMAQPFVPEHPSCITDEPVSKQGSQSKGSSINKPSAGSLPLIGCPCLPPC